MARKSARAAAVHMVFERMLGGDGGEETLRGLIEFTPEEDDQAYIDSLLSGIEAAVLLLLAGGQSVVADHGTDGLLRVTKKSGVTSTSIMSCVHYTSSDDLYVKPGDSTVSFSATRAGRLSIICRGRYR